MDQNSGFSPMKAKGETAAASQSICQWAAYREEKPGPLSDSDRS
jgi:hypothetical protein